MRARVEQCGLQKLQSFAAGLLKAGATVRAAPTYEWSNGHVKGKVGKLDRPNRRYLSRPALIFCAPTCSTQAKH